MTVIMIDPNKPIHDAETELNKNYKIFDQKNHFGGTGGINGGKFHNIYICYICQQ